MTTTTDNSTILPTDKLESQAAPVTDSYTPSPMVAPVIETDGTLPDTATSRIVAPGVAPPAAEAPQRDTIMDPSVVALRAMFPDYEDLILMSVLESVGGDQDRAIDTLLGMSDPEYKGEPPAAVHVQQEQPALSQTELDEQFARHLMLEEQQQQQQQWFNTNQRPTVTYKSHPSQQRWNSQAQPGEDGVEADKSVGDFQEQFSKIAESGKKTIGSLFSKVKAKIQEFDQGRSPGQTSSSSTQPTWDANTSTSGAQSQAQSAAVAQPSYFDPNSHSSTSNTTVSSPPVAHKSPPAATSALKGYDLTPSPSHTPPETPEPLPASPPRASSSAVPIDAGKLGLLPKRPVSLLRDPPPVGGSGSPPAVSLHSQPTRKLTEDDYGLEYTENPFEEPEKK
ncbi:hypothetical protein BYT27DRAFT_7220251 [Phlegmacium glaucopus]|nr:hypothetical protein BYT27DRAFT_7220251 [Phlegmacium glaucopus]